jgi:DMSO/TMAO reductase YedYZ molybdopterin-dependent catalytic subunit
MHRFVLLAVFLAACSFSLAQQPAQTKATTGPSEFKIGGAVTTPLTVTAEDLKKMPRKTLRVENAHAKKTEVYEGVPLEALLQKAGVPQGEQLREPRWLLTFLWRLRTTITWSFR